MKKSVLERKMFAGSSPKRESNGILSGFDEETDVDYEDRTPDNLEIIANNLRGDMRSMDERYMELAEMVGDAAFDTPEEVVALMQAQFAQQAAPQGAPQGIAAAGAPQVPSAGGGIMSGMAAPQGAPQAPVQMANGGIVYRQAGTPPWGEGARGQQVAQMGRNISDMMLTGPARAMGDLMQQQSPWLTRASQQAFQPVSRLAGQSVNMLNAARPYYNQMGPYGRPLALGTAGVLPILGYMAGKEPPPEGGPELSEVPGVDEQGRYKPVLRSIENMPGTPEQKAAVRQAGFTDIQGLGMGTLGQGPTPEQVMNVIPRPATAEQPTERAPVEAPATTVTPPPIDRAQEFRDRVKEKMDIYKEFLGDDPEFRKAQALFLLAESALNVAGSKGYSMGERLAKGLKGLPAGMAAIGSEAEKTRRAIAASAIGAVEQEFTDARRLAATLAREQIRRQGITTKVQSLFSSIKSRMPGMDDDVAMQLATDLDNGTVKPNEKTGEYVDNLAGRVRWSPHKPLNTNSIGFLDPQQPFVRTTEQTLEPATLGEREDLLKKRVALQKRIEGNNDMIKMIYGDTVGFLPTIQSGVSQLVLSTFGDVGLGLTDVQKNQIRDRLQQGREELIKANLRNAGRPAVYDQKKMESLIRDPNAFFASPELLISNVSNLQREDINELARIDSQLFGVPLKQLDRVPVGSRTDPLPLTPNSQTVLDQMFTNRPNMGVWIRYPDGVTERMTSQQYRAQRQAQ